MTYQNGQKNGADKGKGKGNKGGKGKKPGSTANNKKSGRPPKTPLTPTKVCCSCEHVARYLSFCD